MTTGKAGNGARGAGGPPPRKDGREERLKAALRANLRRRKARARLRGEGRGQDAGPAGRNGD